MSRIEREAVTYFINLFDSTKRLQPNISMGDKGNITDGYVDVFKNEYDEQTNHTLKDGNFLGRLNVQVKGKSTKNTRKRLPSFELARSELENIKAVGGVVLLVASIPKDDPDQKTPYFADLTPSNVDSLLEQMPKTQSAKSVPLREFPMEIQDVYNYIKHLQQRQRKKSTIYPSDSIIQNATGFAVSLPYDIDPSKPQIFGGPGSIAIITASGMNGKSQVINGILQVLPSDYVLHENEDLEISCSDVTFNKTRKRRTLDDKTEFYVSPGISMVFDPSSKHFSFGLRYQTYLYYILKDLRFMQSLKEGKWITFNGENAARFDPSSKKLKEHLEPLPFLNELEDLCAEFGVDPKLFKIADLPNAVSQALWDICTCMFHGGRFENKQEIPLRHTLELGESKLQLIWHFDEESKKWLPSSFFDSSKHIYAAILDDHDKDKHLPEPVTPYEFFSKDDLGTVLNLNPEMLVESYQRIPGDRGKDLAHSTVLKLIASADSTLNRRHELLAMAATLNNWILEVEPSVHSHEINKYQIKKRMGELSDEDLQRIKEMWQSAEQKDYGDTSLSIEIATSILLGKTDGIGYLLDKMDDADQESFKSLPLFYLHENHGNPYILGEPNNEAEWMKVKENIEQEYCQNITRLKEGRSTAINSN